MITKLKRWLTGFGPTKTEPVNASMLYRSKNAAILHIDMVESTRQVQQNPLRAHLQIQHFYSRLERIGSLHHAIPRELRGDAAVIEFPTVTDAILTALAIHSIHAAMNISRLGRINPEMRTGISFGEVIGDSGMVTGQAVIRAQRLEQLAAPGEVLVDQCATDQLDLTQNIKLKQCFLRTLKGFNEPVKVCQAVSESDKSGQNLGSYFRSLACQF
jgi:class 3 adenylate cyclase